jgi:hypothetical protein
MSTILIGVSLIVSLIACISQTTNKTEKFPRNVTVAGWVLISLAVVTAGINYWQARKKAFADSVEESLALQRLETAIYTLMTPVTAISDPPELSDRFQVASNYGKAGVVAGLCDIDILKNVGRIFMASEYDNKPWGDFITDETRQGLDEIARVQSAYGKVLGDDINLLIGKVIAHPWNEFLLAAKARRIRSHASTNTLCLKKPEKARQKYVDLADDYWKTLATLETRVGRRYCALRAELHIRDVPPLFLRYISGLFFVPDASVTAPKTDNACDQLRASAGSHLIGSLASYP